MNAFTQAFVQGFLIFAFTTILFRVAKKGGAFAATVATIGITYGLVSIIFFAIFRMPTPYWPILVNVLAVHFFWKDLFLRFPPGSNN